MAAMECFRPRSKRDFRTIEEETTYDSRKIQKSSDIQLPERTSNRQGEHIETGKTETASNSKWQTSSQQQRSQEKLREIFGPRKYKNIKEMFNFEESDDSGDEEEGQEGINTEGYELTIKALDAMFGKPVS